ncbi:hypothetical protein M3Y97_00787000 [Aphelenchoides bicaudatus]|nr:hypothetical protein M3Y97_00787000 [Aphelenchoides bicaudatus]
MPAKLIHSLPLQTTKFKRVHRPKTAPRLLTTYADEEARSFDNEISYEQFNSSELEQYQQPNNQEPFSACMPLNDSVDFNSNDLQSSMPRCSVCKGESTGIHFGAEACSACAAYFRRTVVLKKTYTCPRNNNCNIELDSQNRKKCKSCRYAKCLKVGMDFQAVQGRRDAIGRYSMSFKREYTEPTIDENTPTPKSQSADEISTQDIESTASTSGENLGPVLKELKTRYTELNRLRKTFYCQTSLNSLLDDSEELKPTELGNFKECMYEIWKVEPRICINFVQRNIFLKEVCPDEKTRIFANFLLSFHAIEEPFLTFKHGGLNEPDRFWMMSNRVFMKFAKAEEYFDVPNLMDGLNLDKKSALNLFVPSFENSLDTIGKKMEFINLDETELLGLFGIALFDPNAKIVTAETRKILAKHQNQLFKDLYSYYKDNDFENPEIRLGNLILLLQGVKIHAMKYRENIQLLQFFKVVPISHLLEEILSITASNSIS